MSDSTSPFRGLSFKIDPSVSPEHYYHIDLKALPDLHGMVLEDMEVASRSLVAKTFHYFFPAKRKQPPGFTAKWWRIEGEDWRAR